ncbi:hypothetical protein AMTRI_Chr10g6590 [Amborella trichopoda]
MPHLRCIKPSISSSPPPQLNLLLSPPSFLPSLLKSCATHGFLLSGHIVHTHLVKTNLLSRPHIATALLSLYAKCSSTPCKAHQLFDEMRERCVVSWTALLSAHKPSESLPLFKQMCLSDSSPNAITMVTLLSSLAHHHFTLLECIHSFIIRSGFCSDLPVSNSLINIYSRCGDFVASRRVFDEMHERDLVSWNSIISGYSQNGDVVKVAEFLVSMRIRGMCPDLSTLGSLASAIGDMGRLDWGRSVHAQVLTCGFESDILVETALMDMYLRCGAIGFASSLFERMTERDLVAWNSMISGLVHNSLPIEALRVFYQMLKSWASFPSSATFASVLAACAQMGAINQGKAIHGYITRRGLYVDVAAENSLVTMYAKCGLLQQSRQVFNRISERNLVSWNAIVVGYAQNGLLEEAFTLFSQMTLVPVRPDSITIAALLQACASLGALDHGKWVHNYVIRNPFCSCISVGTALIDMYSKCGSITTARKCFEAMPQHDVISWTVMISGYGSHGKGPIALELYSDMLRTGTKPNHVTFLSVLCACSHAGLVKEGFELIRSMVVDFGIEPEIEHYASIIDLLSRAGRVEEAYGFLKSMKSEPTIEVLGILLGACRNNGRTELAEVITDEILRLRPQAAEAYVQLAHGHAALSQWDGMAETLVKMRAMGLKKVPGWSFVQLNGTINTFFAYHTSHPQFHEIMVALKLLDFQMREEIVLISSPNL